MSKFTAGQKVRFIDANPNLPGGPRNGDIGTVVEDFEGLRSGLVKVRVDRLNLTSKYYASRIEAVAEEGFKVGDRVQFNRDYAGVYSKGYKGTVERVEYLSNYVRITTRMDKNGGHAYSSQRWLDKVQEETFKVGDRVVYKEHQGGHWRGFVGLVTEVNGAKFDMVIVEQDERNTVYTVGNTMSGRSVSYYKKVEETAPEQKPFTPAVGDKVRYVGNGTYSDWLSNGHKPEGTVIETRPEDNYVRVRWNGARNDVTYTGFGNSRKAGVWEKIEEFTPAPLTFNVGDKVRVKDTVGFWEGAEGTVTERHEGHIKVTWTERFKDTTVGGYGTTSSPEKYFEVIEEFSPIPLKFKVGDFVEVLPRDTNKGMYQHGGGFDAGTILEVAEVDPKDFGLEYRVKDTKDGGPRWVSESRLKAAQKPVEYKFKVGDTVKVVKNTWGGWEVGTTGTVEKAYASPASGVPSYQLKVEGHRYELSHPETDLEAYTRHPLEDAKVGHTFKMNIFGDTDYLVTKIAENKWRQVNLTSLKYLQDMSDSSAKSQYDSFKGALVKA